MRKLTTKEARELGKKSSRKGIPNKTTHEIRLMYKQFLTENWEKMQNDLDQLEPYERIKILLEFSKFVIPTLKSTDITLDAENEGAFKPVQITGVIIK